jgi:adenine-specific DNA-methyltransferase
MMNTKAVAKTKESQAFQQLKEQLREMFQLDRGDLDFGIYRVMNQKREDVTKFLDEQLLPQVREVLEEYQPAGMAGAEDELNKMIASLKDAGVDPDTSPKVQELREKLVQSVDLDKLENEIYSDLYNFFKRYYSDGDFMSMRRYKEGVYALPYEGEEVKLHWANHDQYYIKTSENLKNFTFKAANGKRVRFEVVAGGAETNNNKAQEGKERRFILNPDAPTEMSGDELIIRFEYRPDADKRKQDALNKAAVEALSSLAEISTAGLLELAPTEKKKERTVLEKYLTEYTAKFSFDYFIHKDLGKFLRRELDFYIKNEIFHLDDIENESAPKVESYLGKVKAMRQVAGKIIQFLAQLEDFQKKLWLKKKFVLETHYCVTLDHIIGSDVADELLPIIAANAAQNAEWVKLFAVDDLDGYSESLSVNFLESHDKLLVDTIFFDSNFKYSLLSVFDNLDAQTDGLLVNSENYQALNLLRSRYEGQVDAIYIDPPYNTSASEIAYKNNYKHSSWLSLMDDRLELGGEFLSDAGIICVTIDDVEFKGLSYLLEGRFGEHNIAGYVPIRINPSGRPTEKGFALTHEYAIFATKSDTSSIYKIPRTPEQLKRFSEEDSDGKFEFRNLRREGSNSNREDGQRQFYPIYGNLASQTIRVPEMEWVESKREWLNFSPLEEGEVVIWPVNGDGREKNWRWSEENVKKDLSQFNCRIPKGKSSTPQVYYKYRPNLAGTTPLTLWTDKKYSATEYGTATLKNMFKETPFSYPKSIHAVSDCISIMGIRNENTLVLDFFAGSGTTGQATINFNREDGLKRKYILAEMGEYFSKVTLPRIKKSSYSSSWKNGKPVSQDGITQAIKYFPLEHYDDALDNLALKISAPQVALLSENPSLNEHYMLSYMMEMESKGSPSLLNIDSFADPFAYQLRITRDDDTQMVNVDLIETFNYLLGLTVRTVDRDKNGIVTIVGTNSLGENCLIIWRNVNDVDSNALEEWFSKRYSSKDFEFDAIYVNGDNNIENLKVDGDVWKVRLIEAEFSRLMFDVQDV